MSDETVTVSSGNIFADLGFDNPEEELFKAKLIRRLRAIIDEKKLSESEAAAIVGTNEESMAAMVIGQTENISIEQLVRCLDRLDYTVDIVVRPKRDPTSAAAA